jgi:hypothetical protein
MGFSHAVHILLNINLTVIGRALLGKGARVLESLPSSRSKVMDCAAEAVAAAAPGPVLEDNAWNSRQNERRAKLPEASAKYSKVNEFVEAVRHARRSATRVFIAIHLFAGRRRSGDIEEWVTALGTKIGLAILFLSIDLDADAKSDMLSNSTFSLLMGLCEDGMVDFIGGGPPCSTWSMARFVKLLHSLFPRPLRFRGELEWGRTDLTVAENKHLREANMLFIHTLALLEAVSLRRTLFRTSN